jgi:hypothetical protein
MARRNGGLRFCFLPRLLQPGFDVFSLFFTDVRGYKAAVGVALKKIILTILNIASTSMEYNFIGLNFHIQLRNAIFKCIVKYLE